MALSAPVGAVSRATFSRWRAPERRRARRRSSRRCHPRCSPSRRFARRPCARRCGCVMSNAPSNSSKPGLRLARLQSLRRRSRPRSARRRTDENRDRPTLTVMSVGSIPGVRRQARKTARTTRSDFARRASSPAARICVVRLSTIACIDAVRVRRQRSNDRLVERKRRDPDAGRRLERDRDVGLA